MPARITVLIGAYNAADHLGAALASVRDQVLDDIEVVVVNAGSTDATGALAEHAAGLDRRIRVLHAPHRLHIPGAKNFGLPAVRTPVVATLDADDTLTPTRLVDHLAALDADAGLVAVCGTMIHVDAGGLPLRTTELPPTPTALRFELAFSCPALGSATSYRVEALHRLGGFHDASPWADDYPLLWRLCSLGDVGVLPVPACRYRWHPGQTTQVRRMPQFLDTVLLRRRIATAVLGRRPTLGSVLAWREPGRIDRPEVLETALADLDDYVTAFLATHELDDVGRAWVDAAHTRRRNALLEAVARATAADTDDTGPAGAATGPDPAGPDPAGPDPARPGWARPGWARPCPARRCGPPVSGTDRTRYRVHGVLVAADRVLPGWTVADPDHHGEAWSLSFELGSAPLRREAVPGGGPAHWQWFDGDDATVLLLHGGGDLGVVRITVDRRHRRLAVEHTRDDALDGCIDLLTRWILPDVARAEQTALPLHATALELGGRAVLVCGPSGRGKSSLAAGLLAAGARLVADEPCCVIPGADGAVLPPGRRLLRLNPDTMTAIGGVDTLVPPAGRQVTTDVWGKVVLTDDGPAPPDLSVRTVVMLGDRRPDGPAVEVRPLPGREALLALFAERYARATHPERIRSDFRSATMMLERLTVVEVTVVDDLGRLSEAGRELASLLA